MAVIATAGEGMDASQPNILFVDDEQRVLKSMRAMFRRDFNVYTANSGAEAMEIMQAQSIDVVVSDQRMPEMTGVEVLSEFKQRSPLTVRILLTGYADLAAVEASLNEAEVYKYLMKPCPADQLRSAVDSGLRDRAGEAPLEEPIDVDSESLRKAKVHVVNSAPPPAAVPKMETAELDAKSERVQILVLSADMIFTAGIKQAAPRQRTHVAETLDEALKLLAEFPIGVMVTDQPAGAEQITELSRQVRQQVPELVVILASDRSDASVLIDMINSGHVFRFLLKPLQVGQCKIWLKSAVRRFVEHGGGHTLGVDAGSEESLWQRFMNWFLGR